MWRAPWPHSCRPVRAAGATQRRRSCPAGRPFVFGSCMRTAGSSRKSSSLPSRRAWRERVDLRGLVAPVVGLGGVLHVHRMSGHGHDHVYAYVHVYVYDHGDGDVWEKGGNGSSIQAWIDDSERLGAPDPRLDWPLGMSGAGHSRSGSDTRGDSQRVLNVWNDHSEPRGVENPGLDRAVLLTPGGRSRLDRPPGASRNACSGSNAGGPADGAYFTTAAGAGAGLGAGSSVAVWRRVAAR